jgi:hypothetical protein
MSDWNKIKAYTFGSFLTLSTIRIEFIVVCLIIVFPLFASIRAYVKG